MALSPGDIKSFGKDLLARLWKHDSDADKADVSDVYNRGNDFYGWFMDDRMFYSMGYWENSEEKDLDTKFKKS
jgi:cyclopropane fatty-acyl-phospholipid synthase-like methyltransferase